MAIRTLETDYLVIGCGAAGMAFADALIAASDADVVMLDRRHAPGGHWHDAYPFVRLHQPSAYYGVNSLPLGSEAIDRHGSNQGLYERAGGSEICAYFDRVMQQHLLPSGKVRYFPMCEYLGDHRFVSRVSGDAYEVKVRKRRVDATYLEPSVPATFAPPFEVAPGARVVPANGLAQIAEQADGYVIVGAGKTAIDACLWLLETGVSPEDITWIKPREAWLLNRIFAQCGELVGNLFEGISFQLEAAARATSLDDLFARLEAARQMFRVDEDIAPTMYTSATMSTGELEQLRRIRNVVRLGRVRRIEGDRIVLDGGTIPTSAHHLHVHCAAKGLKAAPAMPIFTAERITLQPIRTGLIPFNSSIVAFVEATRDDLAEKNRLCPPNPLPDVPLDWVRGTLIGMLADYQWSKQPDLRDWLERARGIMARAADPQVQEAAKRFQANVRHGLEQLGRFAAEARM
ncbi:MAG: NAD(P)-binding protein [Desulfobacterales bacterium]|nr:NAD(P)-binding protein [Desulfobacterales bacterium]